MEGRGEAEIQVGPGLGQPGVGGMPKSEGERGEGDSEGCFSVTALQPQMNAAGASTQHHL